MLSPNAVSVIRKAMTEEACLQSIDADPETALNSLGSFSETEKKDILQVLQISVSLGINQQLAQARKIESQLDETLAVASELKNALKKTLKQIDVAFQSTMRMYQISFYLGVVLIVAAIIVAVTQKETLIPVVFGTLGILDVITFFLVKPPERLQSSRASLAQLQAALYNWFMDSVNQHGYLTFLQQQQKLDLQSMQQVSDIMMSHTDKTLEMLQKYCKLV
jgi:hypothetical protein